jgi:hypothetical protein
MGTLKESVLPLNTPHHRIDTQQAEYPYGGLWSSAHRRFRLCRRH